METGLVVTRGGAGGGVGERGKGAHVYGDGWKLDFGGEHHAVYIGGKIEWCTLEIYIML